jgi:hypothetical protein
MCTHICTTATKCYLCEHFKKYTIKCNYDNCDYIMCTRCIFLYGKHKCPACRRDNAFKIILPCSKRIKIYIKKIKKYMYNNIFKYCFHTNTCIFIYNAWLCLFLIVVGLCIASIVGNMLICVIQQGYCFYQNSIGAMFLDGLIAFSILCVFVIMCMTCTAQDED